MGKKTQPNFKTPLSPQKEKSGLNEKVPKGCHQGVKLLEKD